MPAEASGGTTGDAAGINQLHARAARRKLVGDCAAHDAGTDDGDVHMGNSISALHSTALRLWYARVQSLRAEA